MASNAPHAFSVSAAAALGTNYTALEVTAIPGTDAESSEVPDQCFLSWLHGQLDTIAGGATTVTWYIAADAAGDIPLTSAMSEAIVTGATTANKGGVASAIERSYALGGNGTHGSLWVVAKLDAGTCNMVARLYRSRI